MSAMYQLDKKRLDDIVSLTTEESEKSSSLRKLNLSPVAKANYRKRGKLLVFVMTGIMVVLLHVLGAVLFYYFEKGEDDFEFGHTSCIEKARKSEIEEPSEIIDLIDICLKEGSKINTFEKSLFFSWTLYTTIGYGNIFPQSTIGRIITIFYSIIAIPFYISFKFEAGTYVATFLLCLAGKISKRFTTPKISKDRIIFASSFITCTLCILASSGVFSLIENISYFCSLYFGIVTMTLTGIGDVVPSSLWIFFLLSFTFFFITDILSNHLFYYIQAHIRKFCHRTARRILLNGKISENKENKSAENVENIPLITRNCMPMQVMDCETTEIWKENEMLSSIYDGHSTMGNLGEISKISKISAPLATSTPKENKTVENRHDSSESGRLP